MEPIVPKSAATIAPIRGRLIESLYRETMTLADDARAYFETFPERANGKVEATTQIGMACEWLKTTTRLMHVIAWLLTQRAVQVGEISEAQAQGHDRMLGDAIASDDDVCRRLPARARALIAESEQLYDRALHLQQGLLALRFEDGGPVRALIERVRARL